MKVVKLFRPMKPVDVDLDKGRIIWPALASAKIDGVRAIIRGGCVYSSTSRPIPNKHTQRLFRYCDHFDGELVVGDPTDPASFRNTMSGVMSVEGEPDVRLYAFDHIAQMQEPYKTRLRYLNHVDYDRVEVVAQHIIETYTQLEVCEEEYLAEGYEGLILRSFEAPYKMGRSTLREGGLMRLKRFKDAEALVVGFTERMHNSNELTEDELGYAQRSSHKANLVGRGDLGALEVINKEKVEFSVGTGFDDATRALLWAQRDTLIGKTIKYKYFPVGYGQTPRFPVFLGFRSEIDA